MAATNTAKVLMTQLCRKRRSRMVPGCMFVRLKSASSKCSNLPAKTRSDFLVDSRPQPMQTARIMKFLFLLLVALAAAPLLHAESVIAPGATLQKLAGDFKFTEGPAR